MAKVFVILIMCERCMYEVGADRLARHRFEELV